MKRRTFLKRLAAAIPVALWLLGLKKRDLIVRRGWLLKENDL